MHLGPPRTTPHASLSHREPPGRRRGGMIALLTTLLVGLGLLAGAGSAVADEPFTMPQPLVDTTSDQVLAGSTAQVTQAQERVQQDGEYWLWVVYVDSFEGMDPLEWADETGAQLEPERRGPPARRRRGGPGLRPLRGAVRAGQRGQRGLRRRQVLTL